MNGPIKGKDVFIPLDYIIGGQEMAGQGWRMLVECLSVGRCITLPSGAAGAAAYAVGTAGGFTRIRRQFNTPRSEEHTSELQSRPHLVCRLLLEKKKKTTQVWQPFPPPRPNR